MQTNILTIGHQDGDQRFSLASGGYAIEDGAITISVVTDNLDEGRFPACASFCLVAYPLDHELRAGDLFACQGGLERMPYEPIKAFAYFEFHADRVQVAWTIRAVGEDEIEVDLEATHDDIDYYDERAKKTSTVGRFLLRRTAKSDLWVPTY